MSNPRVLLSIDYEPWFAIFRRFDSLRDPEVRRNLDDGFTLKALDPILDTLGRTRASFYLVGEIADWYPDVPRKIAVAGHELGLHCHIHRPLVDIDQLSSDLVASAGWRRRYNVRGYRAPMVGISEKAYPLLEGAGFTYSSSIYAPAGTLLNKGHIRELPVSTLPLLGRPQDFTAPRNLTMGMLARGEFPYGSSLMIGMLPGIILKVLESELKKGLSPVIILHPYELVTPEHWFSRTWRDVLRHPTLAPFTWNKMGFLKSLLNNFPVAPLGAYLDEAK